MAYHRISKEHSLPLKLAAIIPALVVVNIPEGISAAIICLLTIYSAYILVKIYRIQKSPTYIFIIVIYITASVSVLQLLYYHSVGRISDFFNRHWV